MRRDRGRAILPALLGGLVSQMSVETKETAPNILDFEIPEQCIKSKNMTVFPKWALNMQGGDEARERTRQSSDGQKVLLRARVNIYLR